MSTYKSAPSKNWSALTSSDEANRRAAGRRKYNAHRQFVALIRRKRVAALAWQYGLEKRGSRTRIAEELEVHRSTVSKDIKAILEEMMKTRDCPTCGQVVQDILTPSAFTGKWIGDDRPVKV